MPATIYEDRSAADADARRERSLGEHVFIWIAWALAAAFWGATMTSFFGILRAAGQPSPAPMGAADAGGISWAIIDVAGGVVVLGLALAYGAYRYATRDRRMDPVTEAATARLYDAEERADGGGRATETRPTEA